MKQKNKIGDHGPFAGRVMTLQTCRRLVVLVSFFLLALLSTAVRADYLPFNGANVAPNIAEIRIGDEGVHVQLEIYIEDIEVFEALVPDSWIADKPSGRPDLESRLATFAASGLSIRRAGGRALKLSLQRAEPRMRIDRTSPLTGKIDPTTGLTFPKPPEDTRVLFVELFYDFEGNQPDALTIAPPLDEKGGVQVTIGMMVFDRGVPTAKFSFLSRPERLSIAWDDPWYSKFDNSRLSRHHDSALTTFIYVEPREVRHETLVRVRSLQDWVNLGLVGAKEIQVVDRARIKQTAIAYLSSRNRLKIDDVVATPAASRAEFLTISDVGLQIVDHNMPLDPYSTFVGVVLSFPQPTIPQSAEIAWDMFNDRIQQVPATATDPAGPFYSGATPNSPKIGWQNFLLTYEDPEVAPVIIKTFNSVGVPLLSLALVVGMIASLLTALILKAGRRRLAISAGAFCLAAAALTSQMVVVNFKIPFSGPPETDIATKIFRAVLTGMNNANLETSKDNRAQELAIVVSRESLTDVIQELDRALAVQVVGGGTAKVDTIDDVSLRDISSIQGNSGFGAIAEWTVRATTGHWGHEHRQKMRFQAQVELSEDQHVWMLAGLTVINASQID